MLSRKIAPALAILLFFLSYLTWKFYSHYDGTLISHTWMIAALAILLDLIAIILLIILYLTESRKAEKSNSRWIEGLKTTGERIRVDFSTCEIRENSYTEHVTRDDDGTRSLVPYDMHERMVDVTGSVIIFQHLDKRTGRSEKFISPVIAKDQVTLSFYLDRQKMTTLYVDKTDRSSYFFDLDFIDKE